MNIASGQQFRSFAAQNEFSFAASLQPSNSSGVSTICFSGDGDKFDFIYLESGSLFDLNRKHVWSYSPRDTINISGNISPNSINYFINNKPICLHTSGRNSYYKSFFVQASGHNLSYDFYIKGVPPGYQFYFPDSVLVGQKITGYIQNTSVLEKSFQIFSGDVFNENTDYLLESLDKNFISGGGSGLIILDPVLLSEEPLPEPISSRFSLFLNTNFGPILNPVIFTLNPGPIYYIELITGFTGVTGALENFNYGEYYSYELRTLSPTDQNITILLENVSGHTGEIISTGFDMSGSSTFNVSQFIYGFDFMTGFLIETGVSLVQDYYGNFFTGAALEPFSVFQNATGLINYNYNLPLTGGSGTGFAPPGTIIPAQGFISPISGFVFGSGVVSEFKNFNISGLFFNSLNTKNIQQDFKFTGFYTGSGIINYDRLFWTANYITGSEFSGFSNQIVGITGSSGFFINSTESGLKILNRIFFSPQKSGFILQNLVKQNSGLFNSSGSGFSSENNDLANTAFTGESYFYLTGQTGFVGFYFNNYDSGNKKPIRYYSFDLDYNSSFYPQEFHLELSEFGLTWDKIDSKTGYDFYQYSDKFIFCNNTNLPINNDSLYEYARLVISSGRAWVDTPVVSRTVSGIGVKNLEFYSTLPVLIPIGSGDLSKQIMSVTGYGNIITGFQNNLYTGTILNPTGLQPAIFFQTGLLTGFINSGSGEFRWFLNLSGTGSTENVYLNYLTGNKQASNVIKFLDPTGFGLINGDILNISNTNFVFNLTPDNSLFNFSSPLNLITKLNSGATGNINNVLKTIGITGYQSNNNLLLFSYSRTGEDGNSIRVYRNTNNLNSIQIQSRYFTGGQSFRPSLNQWTGVFRNLNNLTVENSGFYNFNLFTEDVFFTTTGTIWEDLFDNYYIETGLFDPRNSTEYSGSPVTFSSGIYSGLGVLPSGQNLVYTGLRIFILKPNPYNVSGNISRYTFSGEKFLFTNLLTS